METSTDQASTVNGTVPDDGPAQDGGILRINDSSDAPSLDPQKSASVYTFNAVSGIVYSRLLAFKSGRDIQYSAMELEGDLAEEWGASDDLRTWTFKLREGVRFQDVAPVSGRAFTSADVVCTIDRIKTLPGVQKNLVDIISTIETPDANTVVFKLSDPYAAFDESMASHYMAMLPCEGTRGEFDLAAAAIGTGPFILQDWQRKVERNYVKNPTYFVAGKPHLDEVNVLIMSDPAAAVAALRTGELDVSGSVNDTILPTLISSNKDIVVRSTLSVGPQQLMFNASKAPFDDYRIRKAAALAWDRKGMGETFFGDFRIAGPIPSVLFGGQPAEVAEEQVPYDPEAAKKLLAEAGFPDGLAIELMITDGYGPQFVNQAQWVLEDLNKAGFKATLKVLDYATFLSTYQARGYEISFGYASNWLTADEFLRAMWVTGAPRNEWHGNPSDPTLDAMVRAQAAEDDRDKREALLLEINDYLTETVLNPFMGIQPGGLLTQQTWVHNLFTHPSWQRGYLADVWLDGTAPQR